MQLTYGRNLSKLNLDSDVTSGASRGNDGGVGKIVSSLQDAVAFEVPALGGTFFPDG